jgi:hypothetical protein
MYYLILAWNLAAQILMVAWCALSKFLKYLAVGIALVLVLSLTINLLIQTSNGIPYRALAPNAAACKDDKGWDILAVKINGQEVNDELSAIEHNGPQWRAKFACVIQHHVIPGYRASDGTIRDLGYDLAFVEFQENGKTYALREPCGIPLNEDCVDEGYGPVRLAAKSQLDAVLDSIDKKTPHYVMVFVHGWRNDASIGNPNVADFRKYAAHVARFIEDRAAIDVSRPKPRVTAIYIGWRGARTDESWLSQRFGILGRWVGNFAAVITLFDRKPVSETIAPSVLSGLHLLEARLDIGGVVSDDKPLPLNNKNKLIVFGHSLGGNLLITALRDDLVKQIGRYKSGEHISDTDMHPVLGDLVVLINPAAEASKWLDIQRAVWQRVVMNAAERGTESDYESSHKFFPQNQTPIIISVTAARDWPPGGFRETDCLNPQVVVSRKVSDEGFEYDYATYDLFPFFKGDFRPIADTLERIALGVDPHDACDRAYVSWFRRIVTLPAVGLSLFLRTMPFMQTNPEQTHTIGHVDPPRAPIGTLNYDYFTGHPFGTTHELRGLDPKVDRTTRNVSMFATGAREEPVTYDAVVSPGAACPVANAWLLNARQEMARAHGGNGTFWDSECAGPDAPALDFKHGFKGAGIAPITRADDPFWNIRAFDTALARHDGYMLSSFICAMNQLVLDDPGGIVQKGSPTKGACPSARY